VRWNQVTVPYVEATLINDRRSVGGRPLQQREGCDGQREHDGHPKLGRQHGINCGRSPD
jgi:hypothetical protein